MRKLLMAATAVVGVLGLGMMTAQAQTPPASGLMSGLGGDGNIFGPTSSTPGPHGLPGSIQAYFRGRVVTEWMAGGDSLDNRGGNKSGNIFFGEYARLYTGFKGVASNGLDFGAFLEVRQNGAGTLGGSTGKATLIFRREVAYIKGNWGELRGGQTDGASGLFMTGTFENFSGGANGDIPTMMNGNATVDWPFPENSGTYGTSKIVYLSPSFSGFDFGIDYEPNDDASGEGNCDSTATSVTCPRESTIVDGGQYRRNTVDIVGRYQGKLGPVALTATAGIMTGGHVHNLSAPASDPTLLEGGLTLAMGGFAVGGNIITGNSNGTGFQADVPLEKGGKHETGFVVGTSYATGPFLVGANYMVYTSQGAYGTGPGGSNTTRRQEAIDVGAEMAWAPGMTAFVEGLYMHRHQLGYNFALGAPGADSNNTSAFGMLIGNVWNW